MAADTLPQLFAEQASATPHANAVVSGQDTMTYRQLMDRVRLVAGHLRARGAGQGTLVGVCVERGADLVAALLGVLASGAAYVPLDPRHPRERLAAIEADAGVLLTLTDADLSSLEGPGWYAAPDPDELAYVIYTSGSTGRPKGVMISHGALANVLLSFRSSPGLRPAQGLVSVTTVSFDIATIELFLPLIVGARTIVATHDEAADPVRLAETIRGVSHPVLQATPATWHILRDTGFRPPEGFLALCGGESLPPDLARWLAEGSAAAWDVYGPTETTVWSSTALLNRDGGVAEWQPVRETRIHVLDELLRPVPRGTAGELYIGGSGLARGYLGRPDLTAACFLPDPHAPVPGARLYRTGDLARERADGSVEILGRLDNQVKIRGHRVELGEVETALAAHPGVGRAVVHPRPGPSGTPMLVAYVTAACGQAPPREELRAHLATRLPAYMLPGAYVVMDAFPLNSNGKVDRNALPQPGVDGSREIAPPRDHLERVLVAAWAEVLGVARVGIHDRFLDLGGDSLAAARLLSRLRAALEADLPLAVLLREETPAGQAAQLRDLLPRAPREQPITPAPRGRDLPLSPGQEGLWFVEQVQAGGYANTILAEYRVRGPLDVDALRVAVEHVAARHEPLRTVFPSVDGQPVQRVRDRAQVEFTMRASLDQAAAAPFDLTRGPLMRVVAAELGQEEHLVSFQWHHLVFDGWSRGVFFGELARAYQAVSAGACPELPSPPVRYADVSTWERRRLADGRIEHALAYWRDQLSGAPSALALPFDRPRPATPTFAGAHVEHAVADDDVAGLRRLCAQQRVTLYTALLAALAILLGRHCRTDDVVVGSPSANRPEPEMEELIGFFVSTLVLRLDLSDEPSLAGLLSHVRDTAIDAHAHRDVPFERLVEDLRPVRQAGRNPLFQVMFAYEGAETGELELDGLSVEAIPVESGRARFDLVFTVRESRRGGLSVELEYSTDLFDGSTAERLVAHYLRLLHSLTVAAPDTGIDALEMATPADRAWLARLDAAELPDHGQATVHGLVAEQARRTPAAYAVSDEQGTLTYAELDERAGRLARRLLANGAGPEVVVGVHVRPGVGAVVALLGVLKAGAAYLPLDVSFPPERLAALVRRAGASLVVSEDDGVFPGAVPLDSDVAPPPVAAPETRPGGLAYITFTSGSTGEPKGVAMAHGALVNLIRWQGRNQRTGTRTAQLTSLNFDVSFQEIFVTLATGGHVVVAPQDLRADAELLSAWLAEREVEHLFTTPTMLDLICRRYTALGRVPERLGEITAAGEQLRITPAVRWVLENSALQLRNHYGPSETHLATTAICPRALDAWAAHPPIGRPITGQRAYVLDPSGRRVPPGLTGELYLGGLGVARGYAGAPGLTAERFLPDPFTPRAGERMYRTGDLVRLRPNGVLDYLGRVDDQFKLRGIRVEPAEIEAALTAHPDVPAAAVVAHEVAPGDKRLVAYVVTRGDVDAGTLREHLSRRLPAFLVPSYFVPMAALPFTRSGKLDRAALPEPRDLPADVPAEVVAPRTPLERAVAAAWADVLGAQPRGVHEDFFTVGGHSLLATQLVSRLRAALAVPLTVQDLFAEPTIARLAALLAGRVPDRAQTPHVRPRERGQDVPLSSSQARLWFFDQLRPGTPEYQLPQVMRVRGPLDTDALRQALERIVARHEVLRTRYPLVDDEPVQHIDPPAPADLPVVDLNTLDDPGERALRLRQVVESASWRPFDLAEGPVFRAALIRLAASEHVLVLVVHHIAADGWSLKLINDELGELYADQEAMLPPLPVQYADVAVWERAWLSEEALAPGLAHWRSTLAGITPIELRTDRPRPPRQDHSGATERLDLPAELADAVRELARACGATPYMVLLAAYAVLLSDWSGQHDLVIGTPTAGRSRPETEALVGCFVNTLALRCLVLTDDSFADLVERVRQRTLSALAQQDVPFDRVVTELGTERDPSRHPLFDVMFSLTEEASLRLDGAEVTPMPVRARSSSFDLTLQVEQRLDGSLSAELEYATALFDGSTARRLLREYARLLREVCAYGGADRPVASLTPSLTGVGQGVAQRGTAVEDPSARAGALHQPRIP
ncbi:amino acid adenylation domain-containing protein [Nonomuraea sp. MTCD27]|uniref:amino acid adenylation domain-containing protein n=1 Tax=Nonomuraea sp. MTCD27 TaxID=1676747 RepID=UPI0035C06A38